MNFVCSCSYHSYNRLPHSSYQRTLNGPMHPSTAPIRACTLASASQHHEWLTTEIGIDLVWDDSVFPQPLGAGRGSSPPSFSTSTIASMMAASTRTLLAFSAHARTHTHVRCISSYTHTLSCSSTGVLHAAALA